MGIGKIITIVSISILTLLYFVIGLKLSQEYKKFKEEEENHDKDKGAF